jgi:hypothetical protein
VTLERDEKKVTIIAQEPFSKRYMKVRGMRSCRGDVSAQCGASRSSLRLYEQYLTKKYLKKQELRDYLRVVAPTKTSYEVCARCMCCVPACALAPAQSVRTSRYLFRFPPPLCLFTASCSLIRHPHLSSSPR